MTTYSDFIAQTLRELEEPSDGVISADSLLEWTNNAYVDFALKTKCLSDDQYATLVVGTESYDLPMYSIDAIAVQVDGRNLIRLPLKEYVEYAAQEQSGTPIYYTVYQDGDGQHIQLYPIPASAGTVHFWRTYRPDPVTTTDSTDELPFNGEHDDALRYFVKTRAFEQMGDDRANYFRNLYNEEVLDTAFETGRMYSSDAENAPAEVY